MRRTFVTTVVLGMLVVGARTADAKIAGEATISGPGLPGGSITLDGSDGGGWAASSGLLDVNAEGSRNAPTHELGPRYEVVLDVRQPPQAEDVVQHLYPFAEGGALLYTPPGQRILDFDAPSGWAAGSPQLVDLLERAGLPEERPVTAPEPSAPQPDAANGVAPLLPWALAGVAGLLVLGIVATTRRSRLQAAPR